MPEMQRRVWWRVEGPHYFVEVRFGIRVAHKVSGEGSRDEAIDVAEKLARQFDALEIREEGSSSS